MEPISDSSQQQCPNQPVAHRRVGSFSPILKWMFHCRAVNLIDHRSKKFDAAKKRAAAGKRQKNGVTTASQARYKNVTKGFFNDK
jgi:hypothetical protein